LNVNRHIYFLIAAAKAEAEDNDKYDDQPGTAVVAENTATVAAHANTSYHNSLIRLHFSLFSGM
jgi:hypothetical protein